MVTDENVDSIAGFGFAKRESVQIETDFQFVDANDGGVLRFVRRYVFTWLFMDLGDEPIDLAADLSIFDLGFDTFDFQASEFDFVLCGPQFRIGCIIVGLPLFDFESVCVTALDE